MIRRPALWMRFFTAVILTVALAAFAFGACGDDDDDDDDSSATRSCGDEPDEDQGCLDFCLCRRTVCLDSESRDTCDEQICECAETYGCLGEQIVEDYSCYVPDEDS